MNEILTKEGDRKLLLLGNEAIVRGALEAGIGFASTYPGTPSSEIGDTYYKIAKDAGMYFEYSTNEKVALEIAAGAAHTGIRTMCSMKHVGLNVAADAFMTLLYTGSKGGFIIVCADDPKAHSSQNEQDNRYYAKMSGAPMLEPATPQEAKEMTRLGFELSEELKLPILIRTTTRLNHTTGVIDILPLPGPTTKGHFDRDPQRFVMVPGHARLAHPRLLKILEKVKEISENSQWNWIEGKGEIGVITSGVSYTYVKEVMKGLDIDIKILKLGMTNPLPEKLIAKFLTGLKKVVVVEELEPYLEETVKKVAFDSKLDVEVLGKDSGHFSRLFEYSPTIVREGLAAAFDQHPDAFGPLVCDRVSCEDVSEVPAPPRPPVLCPGCPHRASYYAMKKAVGKQDVVYSNDIGCYTLGVQPPLKAADAILCMGGSVGMAGGFAKWSDQKVIAFIGDSTFFASGVPGLINAAHNNHNFVLCILDNSTTAMTGHQPHPGLGSRTPGAPGPRALDIEPLVKGCGIDFVKTLDPFDMKLTTQTFKEALAHEGFSVIIAKSPCAILNDRAKRRSGIKLDSYYVDQDVCKKCKICINTYGCPSFYIEKNKEGGKDNVFINPSLCDGCGGCPQVCPFGAIKKVGGEQ